METWVHIPEIYCPHCAARSLWTNGPVHVCVGCGQVIELKMYADWGQSGEQRALVKDARRAANVDSNSAVGAFG